MVQEARAHQEFAAALRARVAETGSLARELRMLAVDGESAEATVPYSDLIRQVREDSSRVTDAQVEAVRVAAGSEKKAFELVLATAIGAGLERWRAAADSIREAGDASP
jgi:hypothetical protein